MKEGVGGGGIGGGAGGAGGEGSQIDPPSRKNCSQKAQPY